MASMFVAGDKVWEKVFTPLSLFANGEQGAWFDPSDLTTMFQDAAGTIPAGFGEPVGLILDKSGNGNHASSSAATARPTLGRMPVGGRRNLLTASETETQNALGTSVAGGQVIVGPGTIPVKEFTPTGGAGTTGPGKEYPNAVGVDVTLSVYVMPKGNRYIYLSTNSLGGQSNVGVKLRYDTHTESMTTLYTGHIQAWAAKVQDLGSGLFRCTVSIRPNSAVGSKVFSVFCSNELSNAGGSRTEIAFTDPPISAFSYGGWQAENLGDAALNPDPTAYQRVGASHYDVTEAGVQSLSYLEFDGVDDVLRRPWTLGWAAPAEVHWLGQSNGTSGAGIGGLGIQYQQTATRFGTLVAPNWMFGAPTASDRQSLTTSDGNMSAVAVRGGSATDDLMVAYRDGLVLGSRVPGVALGTAQSGNLQIGDAAYQSHFYGGVMIFRELTSAEREQLVDYFHGTSA